jgi:hypothetical protein
VITVANSQEAYVFPGADLQMIAGNAMPIRKVERDERRSKAALSLIFALVLALGAGQHAGAQQNSSVTATPMSPSRPARAALG